MRAQTVEFLIRNHLLMSQVAFRRDFDDPHVVQQFADLDRHRKSGSSCCA